MRISEVDGERTFLLVRPGRWLNIQAFIPTGTYITLRRRSALRSMSNPKLGH